MDNPHEGARLDILPRMTTLLEPRESTVLDMYTDHPLEDGDVVFLLDGKRILEIAGLADHWASAREGVVHTLTVNARRRVLMAISRVGADLQGGDHALWADLRASLADLRIEVLPLQALRC